MPIVSKEENFAILINLLKQNNIRDVIASPGTTNISFVASIQSDPFFNVKSCVDERSAAYMACGMAAATGQPVILTCTGATASRNYIPGLTEAFYRKLPILAVTATQHLGRVGQNVPQVIDRSSPLADIVKKSTTLPSVSSEEDRWFCNLAVNDALLELTKDGGGPVHINIVTSYSNSFEENSTRKERLIKRFTVNDDLPSIDEKRVAIFIGNHAAFSEEECEMIDTFCAKYNGVVICDHTSNYSGRFKILASLILSQKSPSLKNIDLLIDIGNISGAYIQFSPQKTWRVNPDGAVRDTYKTLEYIFDMDEKAFFGYYNSISNNDSDCEYYVKWAEKDKQLREKLKKQNFPFSNIYVAQRLSNALPDNTASIHLGILNTLRSWNFAIINNTFPVFCNTGGFGIDGNLSSAIGNSLVTDNIVYCFVGDLAFFYDMNSIGNHEIKNNLRVLIINNGCGTEFHNYSHRASAVVKDTGLDFRYFAADGHFGNKSEKLVKNYAENLGFDYVAADDKKSFDEALPKFTNPKITKPIIFEVFTNPLDESKALEMICSLEVNTKTIAKQILGKRGTKLIKKVLGK